MNRTERGRLYIDRVTPEIDGGRYPIKRIVGDVVEVGADVLKDGHDRFDARVRYRGPGDDDWSYRAMRYDRGQDRWFGAFPVDRIGSWQFSVEAWPDPYATWCEGAQKKLAAGVDLTLELLEAAAMVAAAMRKARGEERALLKGIVTLLQSEDALLVDRIERAAAAPVRALMTQFVDRRQTVRYRHDLAITVERERARFGAWYELFPRSQGDDPAGHGTFADATRRLPRLAELGFDVLYLPPIHPIGEKFRKGPNNSLECGPDDPGSPWAIGSQDGGHTDVEPKLGTLADFDHFVQSANVLGIEIALDFALQCSPDHPWVDEHPDWFHVRPDGSIQYAENPPKKYQDIYPINFWCADRENLWDACRDILRFWIDHGVRIFRVDNPHTKPLAFWEWVIEEIRETHPDVIFLAEAFTRPKLLTTLAKLGFSQSYGYFTWRNSSAELRSFVEELVNSEMVEFHRPNFFANTPDILHAYLQTGGRPAFQIRLLLAATLSPTYGLYSGFELCENVPLHSGSEEYLDSEKYQVRVRHWEAEGNLNPDIEAINRIRRENEAFRYLDNVVFCGADNPHFLAYLKRAEAADILVVVNLDPFAAQETTIHVPLHEVGIPWDAEYGVEDLLTGATYTWRGERNYVRLDPRSQVAHVLRFIR